MTRTVFTRKCLSVLGGFFALGCVSVSASENVSFRNEVMAVLSKSGCNAGACHGNANGKAGFKLSLRGEDAVFDFNALTRDEFGRRIDALAPERSLILQKATAELGHEGGKRFEKDSLEYRLLRDWIAQGAADDVQRHAEAGAELVEHDGAGVHLAAFDPRDHGAGDAGAAGEIVKAEREGAAALGQAGADK